LLTRPPLRRRPRPHLKKQTLHEQILYS
jgi:hypothetical protein